MEVVKHPGFAPFLRILISLNSLVINKVNDHNRGADFPRSGSFSLM